MEALAGPHCLLPCPFLLEKHLCLSQLHLQGFVWSGCHQLSQALYAVCPTVGIVCKPVLHAPLPDVTFVCLVSQEIC